jgi:UDP-3-O-[3-hydroxymyristoyl] glucosamine N-acyltransferase
VLDEDVHLAYACNIAHESELKEHTTLGTGVNLSSGVVIGEDCYIGAGVSSTHDVIVEPNTLVAVGSAITENLEKNSMRMWIGVPAITIKEYVKKNK